MTHSSNVRTKYSTALDFTEAPMNRAPPITKALTNIWTSIRFITRTALIFKRIQLSTGDLQLSLLTFSYTSRTLNYKHKEHIYGDL